MPMLRAAAQRLAALRRVGTSGQRRAVSAKSEAKARRARKTAGVAVQRRQRSKCTLSTAAAGVAGGKERAQQVGLASSARLSLARRRQHQLANPAPAAASSLCEPGWFVIKRGCAGAHARGGTGTHHLAILHLHHRVQERWAAVAENFEVPVNVI